ncbi:MAG: pyruvate kinase [Candidatus Wildermuthbacteria bacterium GWA2_46_15]|uniref:Pyruvate kinase n=1 Tax=Candidatus Wildermuthbacteria bacterium GWA2_46_15 TaxID=1802443 RepID=A0A1G2QRG5_9BACT|nr:MAG: pyruvate kinase [Candidatus Wildermuthbacteria bacterium GWA2_46_15]
MKKTKIVCTIGPASQSAKIIKELLIAGMDVARLNLSHGDYASHTKLINTLRSQARVLKKPLALMADLQGLKLRVGEIKDALVLKKNDKVMLSYKKMPGKSFLPLQVDISKFLKKEHRILIDDGQVELRVEKVARGIIFARVFVGGKIISHKGLNLPDSKVSLSALTDKDKKDLLFALKMGVDMIALSFVAGVKDLETVKKIIYKNRLKKNEEPWLVAKIERPEAVKNFDGILKVADAIMVARGDLGVEMEPSQVPIIQKNIIKDCLRSAKPVIVATQMLDSMIRNPRPTRAEVSDVANAVVDHTDAVMLSGETANGKYPVEAVKMMARIVAETEVSPYDDLPANFLGDDKHSVVASVANTAYRMAREVGAKALVGATLSGLTARMLARQRPQESDIIIFTNSTVVYRKMALVWGVRQFLMPTCKTLDELVNKSMALVKKEKLVKKGEKIVLVTGSPVGIRENLNLCEIRTIS